MDLSDLTGVEQWLAASSQTRAIRLQFGGRIGKQLQAHLLAQRAHIAEGVCGGVRARITCLSTRADLPLNEFVGLPIRIRLVADRGHLRDFSLVVTESRQGQSDGALTAVQLVACDALTLMEERHRSRVFIEASALDVARIVLDGWRAESPALASAFDYRLLAIDASRYPQRAFTLQYNEGDSTFLRRVLARAGIGWFLRARNADGPAGDDAAPTHELVLFDDPRQLEPNRAGSVRYHRRDGTEPRDTINRLVPVHRLTPGAVRRVSYDHESPSENSADDTSIVDQGSAGNAIAAALVDSRIDIPHAGDSRGDHLRLTRIDIQRHESRAHALHGLGGVCDMQPGTWNIIEGHPRLDAEPPEHREHICVQIEHWGQNNLPKELDQRVQSLLDDSDRGVPLWALRDEDDPGPEHRYSNRFTLVRRDASFVPQWSPNDEPQVPMLSGVIVGPPGEPVYCDELGRFKVRILGLDPIDHRHANGAGTNGNDGDSAWIRADQRWAGDGFGILFPLRAGMEVDIDFLAGRADRPVITGSRYHAGNVPARFDHLQSLPANRAQSGIVTRELRGGRQQQLRFNDTQGRINVQLGSDHARSQLNLGHLGTPMRDGASEPRGEGIEVRTKAALAVRGEQGVYLSADPLPSEASPALERASLIGLAEALQSIQRQLAQLAARHQVSGADGQKVAEFVRRLQDWENGSNTSPQGGGGGAPMLVGTAPSTVALGSGDGIVLAAQTQLDAISAGNTQFVCGQKMLVHTGDQFAVFAQGNGIRLVTATDSIDIEAHQDSIRLTAAKRVVISAGDEIVLSAPKVRHVAQGVQVDLGDGQITQQSSGAHVIRSASFAHLGPGSGTPAELNLPTGSFATEERCRVVRPATGEGVSNCRYTAYRVADGSEIGSGVTDEQGFTDVFNGVSVDAIRIVIHPESADRADSASP